MVEARRTATRFKGGASEWLAPTSAAAVRQTRPNLPSIFGSSGSAPKAVPRHHGARRLQRARNASLSLRVLSQNASYFVSVPQSLLSPINTKTQKAHTRAPCPVLCIARLQITSHSLLHRLLPACVTTRAATTQRCSARGSWRRLRGRRSGLGSSSSRAAVFR